MESARLNYRQQSAALSFLETWNPALLTDARPNDDVIRNVGLLNGPERLQELARERQNQSQPLEERDRAYLSCEQKLRILADERKLENFSKRFAPYLCAGNGAPKECEKRYLINAEMPSAERDARRIKLFQWAWYYNGVCEFEKPSRLKGNSDVPAVDDLLRSALSGEVCESDGCGD
ncbi:MAG: hypothetical protein EOP06_12670 [Proteobacteria bacterium]|nr:MAG: hypothetical protein EOP06_12670 [Pseudomonadota bacterium]